MRWPIVSLVLSTFEKLDFVRHPIPSFGTTPRNMISQSSPSRLAASHSVAERPRLAGLAKFSSGVRGLGSKKKHLKGFGR
jgi:hypothetical protein